MSIAFDPPITTHTLTHMHTHTHTHVSIHTYTHTRYIHTYHTYLHTHIHTHTYIHTHTHTGQQNEWTSWKHYLSQTDAESADESLFNEVTAALPLL